MPPKAGLDHSVVVQAAAELADSVGIAQLTLAGQHLLRVRFDPNDPNRIAGTERLLAGRFGRIRDVVTGPDGALYLCTSNRDGRNTPVADDDRLVKLSAVR